MPGESRVLTDAVAVRTFELAGAGEAREYEVIVMSGSQIENGVTPIKLRARAADVAASVTSARETTIPVPSASRSSRPLSSLSAVERASMRPGHMALQSRMQAELARVRPRISPRAATSRSGTEARLSIATSSTVPTVGQAVSLTSGVRTHQVSIGCETTRPIDGTVRAVGDNFVIVEEDAVAGSFTAQDYVELDAELDKYIAPVDQQYFGAPADLDGNDRVIALFTKEVNSLTDKDSPVIILGFFWAGDLSDPADCAPSNEGEILWLRAPDPDGDYGAPTSVELVKRIARSLVSHEYQHLLNAEQRVVIGGGNLFTSPEHIWMNEGMSHVAEEVSGLFRIGAGTRQHLDFDDIAIGGEKPNAFEDFHADNFRNLTDYLSAPNEVAALSEGNPENSFPMRGYGYLFLRWLGDRFGPAMPESIVGGSGEDALFRELSSGGPGQATGVNNVLRAISQVAGETFTWDDLLSEYFAAPAIVDAAAAPTELRFRSWDFPELYAGMAANSVPDLSSGFPLRPLLVGMGSGTNSTSTFDLGASTARYYRFTASGPHPDMRIEITSLTNSNLSNSARARVIVVRTK